MSLSCVPDTSTKALVFQCNELTITKGTETEARMPLSSFAIPVENYYTGMFILTANTVQEISFGNMPIAVDTVKFLLLMPDFSGVPDGTDEVLAWAWASEDPDYNWVPLGRILFLTGTELQGVPAVVVGSTLDVDVPVRLFMGM